MAWWRRPSPEPPRSGAQAEEEALRLLEREGLRVVERNFRCKGGELDLVLLDSDTLVVVEVRARTSARFAHAAESIDARKQARIIGATQMFVASHPLHAQRAIRFDVVAFDGTGAPRWIQAAFDAG